MLWLHLPGGQFARRRTHSLALSTVEVQGSHCPLLARSHSHHTAFAEGHQLDSLENIITPTAANSSHAYRMWGQSALRQHLATREVRFEEITHSAEGRTVEASRLRGHTLAEAAKSLIIDVRMSGKRRQFVNAVVSGNQRVDFARIADVVGGRRAGLASPDRAFELTGCPMGAVIPFSFREGLELIVDQSILEVEQVVFNAGVLDRSLIMRVEDYVAAACPRFASIGVTHYAVEPIVEFKPSSI